MNKTKYKRVIRTRKKVGAYSDRRLVERRMELKGIIRGIAHGPESDKEAAAFELISVEKEMVWRFTKLYGE